MAKKTKAKTMLAFSCVHIPQQNRLALEVFCLVAERLQPELIVFLGDMLDCMQFSTWPATYGAPETEYESDLQAANDLLDRLQKVCEHLVFIEGNHEDRINRWAAKTSEGKGAYSMLAPKIKLRKGRSNFKYICYGSINDKYPHYAVNSRIVAVHGWSYAKNATKNHLGMSQGKSIIHGHTHRVDSVFNQSIWKPGIVLQGISAGCLCKLIPIYGTGRPVEWVNAFVVGYLGRRSDTLYPVSVVRGGCVLPDGTEITT